MHRDRGGPVVVATLLRQDAGGRFQSGPSTLITTLLGAEPYGLDFRLADINGDGRTDFVHRSTEGVAVLLGASTGQFQGEVFTPYGQTLPDTAGVRFVDLNGDRRDDLIWLDRQAAPGDARYIHTKLASASDPGAFGEDRVSLIEIGDSWVVKGAGADPTGVGGYDFGDVTGDGIPDIANVGTFGSRSNSGAFRTAALFVKPGLGNGRFGEMRVWRLPLQQLSVKGDVASTFTLLPVLRPGRADVVFFGAGATAPVDIVSARANAVGAQ